jgi:hypothetical protein
MVKHVEAALRLVNRCLLLYNLFRTHVIYVREQYSGYLIETLHLFYHYESLYV